MCDVAPTILDLLGLEIPEGKTFPSNVLFKGIIVLESDNPLLSAMTGRSLLERK